MVFIYGAGSHGKVVLSVLEAMEKIVIFFVDDYKMSSTFSDLPVIPKLGTIDVKNEGIIAIGNNQQRKNVAIKLSANFIVAIHPQAFIHQTVKIGFGTVVMARACVQVDVIIGMHCIINSSACIEHDCVVEDYVHVSPNVTLCGNVTIGQGSWIGAGATVIEGVKIGKWVTIGAGAVVIKDVPDGAKLVGTSNRFL